MAEVMSRLSLVPVALARGRSPDDLVIRDQLPQLLTVVDLVLDQSLKLRRWSDLFGLFLLQTMFFFVFFRDLYGPKRPRGKGWNVVVSESFLYLA